MKVKFGSCDLPILPSTSAWPASQCMAEGRERENDKMSI